MTRRLPPVLVLSLGLAAAHASHVDEPLESVLQKARAAVEVEVTAVSPPRADGYFEHIDFEARPLRVLFGDPEPGATLSCRYSQGLLHRRGEMTVFPLVSGSGLERQLKKGDRVILLLGESRAEPGRIDVLRVEPLSNEGALRRPPEGAPARPVSPSPGPRPDGLRPAA